MANPHQGHRARLKEEFRKYGLDHFPDHKILEMLLFYSVPRSDTNEIAHELLERFGSFSSVFDTPADLLLETKGLGEESATLIKFISALIQVYMDDYSKQINVINTVEDGKNYIRHKFVGQQTEKICITCLAANRKVIFHEQITEGSPEKVSIRTSDIIRVALRANSVSVILSHNHPYGLPLPSRQDRVATQLIQQELARVDVDLYDHIIVAPSDVFSMREHGMMNSNARA